MIAKIHFPPRKLSRDSAYAAIESTVSTSSVTLDEMKTELKSHRKIGISSGRPSTSRKWVRVHSCGKKPLNWMISESGLKAVRKINATGMMHASATRKTRISTGDHLRIEYW